MLTDETVEKIMRKSVFTVGKDEPVRAALETMDKHDIGAVIIASDGKPIGIVTERDVIRKIVREDLGLSKPVGSMMSRPLISVTPDTAVTKALHIMVDHNIRRLPVVKGGNLVGIIVERDIIRWLAERPDVILDLLSLTDPNVVKDALVAMLKDLKLKEKI